MGDIEKKTQNDVVELREQLKSMSCDMRMFSLEMRLFYVEKAVGTTSALAWKFRKPGVDTRNDAMVYLKGVLSLSTKFFESISEYFEYYEGLDYNEWRGMLSNIIQETVSYRELCESLVKMREDMLVLLKEEFEKKKELEEKPKTKHGWAIGLAFTPFVGAIVSPALPASTDTDLADAVVKCTQTKTPEAAAITACETLIPALEGVIDAIKKFQSRAEKGQRDPKLLHYKVMKQEARDMKSICQVFCAVLPDILRIDVLVIPSKGTDKSYEDILEKLKMFVESCKASKTEK